MHTLKVSLKQHTPLIHFQHDQDGATLRASEVKPKLDRFILTRLGNGDYQSGFNLAKDNGWLIGKGDHPALDYKIRIEGKELETLNINERQNYNKRHEQKGKPFIMDGNTKYLAKERRSDHKMIFDLSAYPLFFANMDSDFSNPDEYRKFSVSVEPLSLQLLIRNDSLSSFITDPDFLNDFFFQTNFGTRQSKGFGSFSIDNSDPLFRKRSSRYWFKIDSGSWDDVEYVDDEYKRVFEFIDLFLSH